MRIAESMLAGVSAAPVLPAAAVPAVPVAAGGVPQALPVSPFTDLLNALAGADAAMRPAGLPDDGALPDETPDAVAADEGAADDSASEPMPAAMAIAAPLMSAPPITAALPLAGGPVAVERTVGAKLPATAVVDAAAPVRVAGDGAGLRVLAAGQDANPAALAEPLTVPAKAGAEPAALPAAGRHGIPAVSADAAPVVAAAQVPVTAPVRAGDEAAAATLKLPNGAASQWRQPLLQALGERLRVDLDRGVERAVIRLDPPAMGSVEIVIRHQAGSLQVHLSATHGDVLRQLQGMGDSLREDPVLRQYANVSVQVSDGSQDGSGRQRREQDDEAAGRPGRALGESMNTQAAFALNPDQE